MLTIDDLPSDLRSHPGIDLMVAGANGQAARVAPALFDTPTEAQASEARLLLLGAVVRWCQNGAGGVQQQTAGPFMVGVQTTSTGYRLWPSEVAQLREIADGTFDRKVGSIDTAPGLGYIGDYSPGSDFFFGPS